MQYRTICHTDLRVSAVCLGTAEFGGGVPEEEAFRILDAFAEGGGNFLDTANVYGRWFPGGGNRSEQTLGKWLRSRRAYDRVIVATKAAHYAPATPQINRVTEADIRRDVEESRQTLGLDRLDFLWLHRDNPDRPIEEIVDILEKLTDEGLIRYYGASNYAPERLQTAVRYAAENRLHGFCAVSNEWNPAVANPGCAMNADPTLVHAEGKLDAYECLGLSFIPYHSTAKGFFSKLASGELYTEKYARLRACYLNAENKALGEMLADRAAQNGSSVQTELLRYILANMLPILPITTVSRVEQVADILRV